MIKITRCYVSLFEDCISFETNPQSNKMRQVGALFSHLRIDFLFKSRISVWMRLQPLRVSLPEWQHTSKTDNLWKVILILNKYVNVLFGVGMGSVGVFLFKRCILWRQFSSYLFDPNVVLWYIVFFHFVAAPPHTASLWKTPLYRKLIRLILW